MRAEPQDGMCVCVHICVFTLIYVCLCSQVSVPHRPLWLDIVPHMAPPSNLGLIHPHP